VAKLEFAGLIIWISIHVVMALISFMSKSACYLMASNFTFACSGSLRAAADCLPFLKNFVL
jgi:hypothetical protein